MDLFVVFLDPYVCNTSKGSLTQVTCVRGNPLWLPIDYKSEKILAGVPICTRKFFFPLFCNSNGKVHLKNEQSRSSESRDRDEKMLFLGGWAIVFGNLSIKQWCALGALAKWPPSTILNFRYLFDL